MRRFVCETCRRDVPFDGDRCASCGAALGYVPHEQAVRTTWPVPGGYAVAGEPTVWWRCLNHAWGCNWLLRADEGAVWCVSCRLTRGRPDLQRAEAVAAWSVAEQAKRRLVHQLLTLGLPVTPRRPGEPQLVFDLLDIGEGAGATGHLDGTVSLDLREVDDVYRAAIRTKLGEPFRTIIGHLRHEVGHHYWSILVADAGVIEEFRRCFGDERRDYGAALAAQYGAPPQLASPGHVTPYAMAHPAEDWAETFAHYLHLRDGLETAASYGLVPPVARGERVATLLDRWQGLVDAVNAVSEGLGQPPVYPVRIDRSDRDRGATAGGTLLEKFELIHRQIEGRNP